MANTTNGRSGSNWWAGRVDCVSHQKVMSFLIWHRLCSDQNSAKTELYPNAKPCVAEWVSEWLSEWMRGWVSECVSVDWNGGVVGNRSYTKRTTERHKKSRSSCNGKHSTAVALILRPLDDRNHKIPDRTPAAEQSWQQKVWWRCLCRMKFTNKLLDMPQKISSLRVAKELKRSCGDYYSRTAKI